MCKAIEAGDKNLLVKIIRWQYLL